MSIYPYRIEECDASSSGSASVCCKVWIVLTSNGAIHENVIGLGSNYEIARANAYQKLAQEMLRLK